MSEAERTFIGTAGLAIPAAARPQFPAEGTALERYSAVFDAVEINSSFHRRHTTRQWSKWADATPSHFRFAAKLPKTITHKAKLVDVAPLIDEFAEDVAGLGQKLGVVLVQLPPSLAFDEVLVGDFFGQLADRITAPFACEPRHVSWFEPEADKLLINLSVARVAADPALSDVAAHPGGSDTLAYWRLHGSPRLYYSEYGQARVADYAARIAAHGADEQWCMFDNTASSAAIGDALLLKKLISASQ